MLRRLRRSRLASVPALMGAALLVLAVPQMADAIARLYAGSVVAAGERPSDVEMANASAALLELTDQWLGDPYARNQAGTLHMFLAFAAGPDREPDAGQLAHAIDDLVSGIRRAPADAVAWTAFAQGQLARGDKENARRALRTSLLLASYEPRLAVWRAKLGLQILDRLDPEEFGFWSEQVLVAWDHSRAALLALARRPLYAIGLRAGLAADPRRLYFFDRVLSEQR